ncbi:MAG: helix-turn-helix domain-containing protein [Butyricicoccus sp.]
MLLKDRLRELRGNRTQTQMAELLGVKPNNYNGWENGKEPNVETLIRIADYHNVTLDYLMGRVDYKHPEYRQVNIDTGLTEAAIHGVQTIRDTSTDENKINALNYLLELENKENKNKSDLIDRTFHPKLSMLLEMIAEPDNQHIEELRTLFQLNGVNISREKQKALERLVNDGERKKLSEDLWIMVANWRRDYQKQK